MPELPEVEVLKRSLKKKILFQKIKRIKIYNRNLRYKIPITFNKYLKNRVIKDISRLSKYIIFHLDLSQKFLIHLGMSGTIHIINNNNIKNTNASFYSYSNLPKTHNHLEIHFKNNIKMIYNDPRRFGYFKILKNNFLVEKPFVNLGPDPIGENFNFRYISKFISNKKRKIKNLIMDQNFVCGIGNIYANEILYYCKLKPTKIINKLTNKDIINIIIFSKKVLKKAILFGGSSIRDYKKTDGLSGNFQNNFKVYGKSNTKCPRRGCSGQIVKIFISNRSSFYCPKCQH